MLHNKVQTQPYSQDIKLTQTTKSSKWNKTTRNCNSDMVKTIYNKHDKITTAILTSWHLGYLFS